MSNTFAQNMTDLVKQLKSNDIDCFGMIYSDYHSKLSRFIYNRTQSSYLTQEVVQLTFIKLWQGRDNLSDEFTIDIQLFRIARTTLIDELRKETVKLKYNKMVSDVIEIAYEDTRMADKETLKNIFVAVERLPAVQKKVFKLSRINGFSHKQIADILSISPKTVENHISKAIKQLRGSVSHGA